MGHGGPLGSPSNSPRSHCLDSSERWHPRASAASGQTEPVNLTMMVLHDDGKSCSIYLPRSEGYTFREAGEPSPAARVRVGFTDRNEPLWIHIDDLGLVDEFWDDLAAAVEPSVLTALQCWPGLQPGVYLFSGQELEAVDQTSGASFEPHPTEADDLAWWVLLDGRVYSDDPVDDLTEAARTLERRISMPPLEPGAARHRWGLIRASRSWGYRNFVGT